MNLTKMNIEESLRVSVRSSLTSSEKYIVVVDDNLSHGAGDCSLNRNVYAFDLNGEFLWQIEEAPDGGSQPKPYLSVSSMEGRIVVKNWIGVDYQLDVQTGKVQSYGPLRRPW